LLGARSCEPFPNIPFSGPVTSTAPRLAVPGFELVDSEEPVCLNGYSVVDFNSEFDFRTVAPKLCGPSI
jgi:hypothetical protein